VTGHLFPSADHPHQAAAAGDAGVAKSTIPRSFSPYERSVGQRDFDDRLLIDPKS
jgi:hypothetical protein